MRRPGTALLLLAGTAVTALSAVVAASGTVGPAERAVFAVVNGWPEGLRPVLWPAQLLGVLGVPLLVAAVALALRRWRLAAALVLLVPAKLVVEKDVLKELVHRERPGTTIPGAVLRDVPSAGPSFPSGHAIIAFGIVVLLAPYLRHRWQLALAVCLAVLNGLARIYLGAHSPLDVVGGAAAGVALGAALSLLVGVPPPATPRRPVPAPPAAPGRR